MQTHNTRMLTFSAACVVLICMPQKRAPAQEPPTIDQIIEGVEQTEKILFQSESLFIRYERSKCDDLNSSSKLSGKLLAEWTLAYKRDKWFNERRFTQPMETKKFKVPGAPETQIVKERFLVEWNQDSKLAVVDQFNEGRNIYAGLFFTRNLSLDAPKYIAKINGADIATIRKIEGYKDNVALPFLPDFLRDNKANYKVLPNPEIIDDMLCWIVEWPGMDRFWVDPQHGFAIPRRIYCWAPGKPRRFEFRHSDYKEVKPGLWLPFTQNEFIYASIVADREPLWNKVVSRCEYRVRSIEFDHVPDSLFDVELPAGTRVVDMVRDFHYVVSGKDDAEPFNAAIAEAKRRHARATILYWLGGGALLLLAMFGIYWVRSRRKRIVA